MPHGKLIVTKETLRLLGHDAERIIDEALSALNVRHLGTTEVPANDYYIYHVEGEAIEGGEYALGVHRVSAQRRERTRRLWNRCPANTEAEQGAADYIKDPKALWKEHYEAFFWGLKASIAITVLLVIIGWIFDL